MTAVDTNLVIRFLIDDHGERAKAARHLLSSETIWIAKTVLLESAWVLEYFYGFDQPSICAGLASLIGLQNVRIEDEPCILAALVLAEAGLEFADALHLASRPDGATFASIDRALVRRAARAGVTRVIEVRTA